MGTSQLFASSHYHKEVHAAVWETERRYGGQELSEIYSAMGEDSYSVLSVGADGHGLPLHGHAQAWLAQLQGSKLWYFLRPDFPFTSLPTQVYRELFFRAPRHWSNQTLRYFLDNPKLAPTKCRAVPGDIIAVPASYFHATENVGEGLSLGGQMDVSVDEDFVADPRAYAAQMPNSPVQLRNTAMLLEAVGDIQSASAFAVTLLQHHPLEFSIAIRTVRWLTKLDRVSEALEGLLFYLGEFQSVHRAGLLSRQEHAKYSSELALELQTNIKSSAALVQLSAGGFALPDLLQQVHAAAAPHHESGVKGLALCREQFGRASEGGTSPVLICILIVLGLSAGVIHQMITNQYRQQSKAPIPSSSRQEKCNSRKKKSK